MSKIIKVKNCFNPQYALRLRPEAHENVYRYYLKINNTLKDQELISVNDWILTTADLFTLAYKLALFSYEAEIDQEHWPDVICLYCYLKKINSKLNDRFSQNKEFLEILEKHSSPSDWKPAIFGNIVSFTPQLAALDFATYIFHMTRLADMFSKFQEHSIEDSSELQVLPNADNGIEDLIESLRKNCRMDFMDLYPPPIFQAKAEHLLLKMITDFKCSDSLKPDIYSYSTKNITNVVIAETISKYPGITSEDLGKLINKSPGYIRNTTAWKARYSFNSPKQTGHVNQDSEGYKEFWLDD